MGYIAHLRISLVIGVELLNEVLVELGFRIPTRREGEFVFELFTYIRFYIECEGVVPF